MHAPWLWFSILVLLSWGTLGIVQPHLSGERSGMVRHRLPAVAAHPLQWPIALSLHIRQLELGAGKRRVQWPGGVDADGCDGGRRQGVIGDADHGDVPAACCAGGSCRIPRIDYRPAGGGRGLRTD